MNIFEEIKLLLAYGLKNDLIGKYDEIIARNEIIALLNLEEWKDTDISSKIIPEYPNEILENICNWAVENKIIEDTIAVRDLFDTKIMGKITPSATHVIDKFIKISNLGGIEKATDNYYEFAQKTNYIRRQNSKKYVLVFKYRIWKIWK